MGLTSPLNCANMPILRLRSSIIIFIKIELWPWGDRSRRKTLGEMVITNDGTGSQTTGNYKVWHRSDPKPDKQLDNVQDPGKSLLLRAWLGKMVPSRIEGHPRQAVTVWHLIRKALEASGFKEK